MKIQMLMGALVLSTGGLALAQTVTPTPTAPVATPRVEQREASQEKRISQGEASGQLTPRESARLERQQGRIERAETKAQADGKVTPQERAHLDRMQDHANRDIKRDKHDGQRDMNHDGRKDHPRGDREHSGKNKG